MALTERNFRISFFTAFVLLVATILWLTISALAQTETTKINSRKTETQPVFTHYKEIKIGTTAEEVRDKLGKAKIDDQDGFFYEISDEEMAQIRVDKNKKVRLISVTYLDKSKTTPQYTDVFGADAIEAAQPDGSVYKLVRYPQAGYWVAYSRTAGDEPTVTVTMQKMRTVK